MAMPYCWECFSLPKDERRRRRRDKYCVLHIYLSNHKNKFQCLCDPRRVCRMEYHYQDFAYSSSIMRSLHSIATSA